MEMKVKLVKKNAPPPSTTNLKPEAVGDYSTAPTAFAEKKETAVLMRKARQLTEEWEAHRKTRIVDARTAFEDLFAKTSTESI